MSPPNILSIIVMCVLLVAPSVVWALESDQDQSVSYTLEDGNQRGSANGTYRYKNRHLNIFSYKPAFAGTNLSENIGRTSGSVSRRQHPDYTALGRNVGAFIFLPSISIAETYNDNIFARDNGQVSDFQTRVKPVFLLRSNWSRHEFVFAGLSDFGFHHERSAENFIDYSAIAAANIDVYRGNKIATKFSYQRKHEDRGSPNAASTADEPIEYDVYKVSVGYNHKFDNLTAGVRASANAFDFTSSETSAGVIIDNGGRDRTEVNYGVRLGYSFSPGYSVFVDGSMNERMYVRDASATQRDSSGTRISSGVAVDITGVLMGEFSVGMFEQEFDNAAFGKTEGLNVNGDLIWNISDLTSLIFELGTNVNETILASSSGFVSTSGDFTFEHEFRRNIVGSFSVGYAQSTYENIDRDDDIYSVTFGFRYLLNRNLKLNFNYNYQQRDSNIDIEDFSRNRVLLNLSAAL